MSEESYISYNGQRLRKGYTTGTCATAATKANLLMIQKQEKIESVELTTPSGVDLTLPIRQAEFGDDWARSAVVKDGGDDQDATDGADIVSTVQLNQEGRIRIDGGEGVGRVTQEGLKMPPGQAAINPVPRQMMEKIAQELLPKGVGADITISVPEGEEIAKSTFNPRLGILGGISILGTSGIVTPMSEESWKESITIEMEIKKNQGMDRIILTPGEYGEDYVKHETNLNSDYVVQMSNFVGYVLLEAVRIGFKKILLVGHLGKFIKIAGGIFSTHSKDADARAEIMVANLALMGAPLDLMQDVYESLTTEAQAELILQAGYGDVYQVIAQKIKDRVLQLFQYRDPDIEVEVLTFLSDHEVLAVTQALEELEAEFS